MQRHQVHVYASQPGSYVESRSVNNKHLTRARCVPNCLHFPLVWGHGNTSCVCFSSIWCAFVTNMKASGYKERWVLIRKYPKQQGLRKKRNPKADGEYSRRQYRGESNEPVTIWCHISCCMWSTDQWSTAQYKAIPYAYVGSGIQQTNSPSHYAVDKGYAQELRKRSHCGNSRRDLVSPAAVPTVNGNVRASSWTRI